MSLRAPVTLTDPPAFFQNPRHPKQRQYEALRAFYVEGLSSQEAARAFGYSPGAFRVLCHAFVRDPNPSFFVSSRTGPRSQPKKSAARSMIVALRKQNHSVYEISQVLKEQKLPLSPTAVREVLKAEGFAPLPRRRDDERPQRPQPSVEPIADVRAFSLTPHRFFYGQDPIIEKHYVSARSRSQPGLLVFLAQDEHSQTFCYSNADLRKGEESEEIFRFIRFWKKAHGQIPRHLVFDSKLTTQANLARLDRMKIDFITLRRRSSALLREVYGLPRSAWRTIELDVPSRQYQTPRSMSSPLLCAADAFVNSSSWIWGTTNPPSC